jgi:steroid delta-isomerase-like uncharacterized protein
MFKLEYFIPVFAAMLLVLSAQTAAQTEAEPIAVCDEAEAALNAHDFAAFAGYLAEGVVYDFVPSGPPLVGPEQVRSFFEDLFLPFSDMAATEGRVFTAGNVVVAERVLQGTQDGTWQGIPPTGQSVSFPFVDIFEVEGNEIEKLTTYTDTAGALIQLGVMPAPQVPDLVPSIDVPDPEPTGLSPLEANAEAVRRWNNHDPASVAKMYRLEASIFAGPLGMSVDRVAVAALNEMYFQGFSDTRLDPVRTTDLGDGWVLFEHVARGTHDGSFMGVPPAGYMAEVRAVWLTHYDADGLITEQSFYYDNLTLMTQMTTPEWSPEGTWITIAPTPMGNMILSGTWVAQDAAKTRLTGQVEQISTYPVLVELYPDSETIKFAGGVAQKIARNTYEATWIEYFTKTSGPSFEEIVGIGILHGTLELVGPDQVQGQSTGAYYLAAQDADQDGFPDEGQEPAVCVSWPWTSKRLTKMPGCVPTPMP